jgi:hypothetical protein
MNEPLVQITRLDELAVMAKTNNPYDKAAVYSATNTILYKFENSKLSSDEKIIGLVRSACFYISAAVGYEFIINKTSEECILKAEDRLASLRWILNT